MKILHVYPVNQKNDPPSSWRKSQIDSLMKLGVENHLFPLFKRKTMLDLVRYGFRLRKMIEIYKIDLVHCHWGSTLGLFATLFSQKPVVVSFCGSDLLGNYNHKNRKTLSGKVSSFLSKTASSLSEQNIVKSKVLLDAIPKEARYKSEIIPNGVDLGKFGVENKDNCRRELTLPLEKVIVLFVNSEGSWEKNPLKAREIGKKIEENNNFYFLEIKNIDFSQMHKYYSASDFLLITSFHEGSCNVLKEALCSSLKVISTKTGDAEERLKNLNGCLISNDTSEIVSFIFANGHTEFSIPKNRINEISISFVAERLVKLYKKILFK